MPKEIELGNVSASKSGKCVMRFVGALRIGFAAFTGTTLMIIRQVWGETLGGGPVEAASWLRAGLTALAAVCCTFAEVLLGGWLAHREERRLRTRLLDVHFRATVRPVVSADISATPVAHTVPGPRP